MLHLGKPKLSLVSAVVVVAVVALSAANRQLGEWRGEGGKPQHSSQLKTRSFDL